MHVLGTFVVLLVGTVHCQELKKEEPNVDLLALIPEASPNEGASSNSAAVNDGVAALGDVLGILNSTSAFAGGNEVAIGSHSGLLEKTVPQSPGAGSDSLQGALSSLGALGALTGARPSKSADIGSAPNTLDLTSALGALNGALGGGAASSGSAAIPGLGAFGALSNLGTGANPSDSVGSVLGGLNALGSLGALNNAAANFPGLGVLGGSNNLGAAGNALGGLSALGSLGALNNAAANFPGLGALGGSNNLGAAGNALSGLNALEALGFNIPGLGTVPGGDALASLGSLASLGAALGGSGSNTGPQTSKAPTTTTTTTTTAVPSTSPPKLGIPFLQKLGEKKPPATTAIPTKQESGKPIEPVNPFDSLTKIMNTVILHENAGSAVGNSPLSSLLAAGTSKNCLAVLLNVPIAQVARSILCKMPVAKNVLSMMPGGRSDNLSPEDEKSLMMLQELANQIHDVTFDLKEGKLVLRK